MFPIAPPAMLMIAVLPLVGFYIGASCRTDCLSPRRIRPCEFPCNYPEAL